MHIYIYIRWMYTGTKLESLLLVYFSRRYVNKIQTATQPQPPSPHTPPPSFFLRLAAPSLCFPGLWD